VSRSDFLEDTRGVNIDFNMHEVSKNTLTALLALKPLNQLQEREAILSVLNNYHHIEDYIGEHIDMEDTFYIINKKFWDAWS
jgi:hypothetical protein